MPLSIFPVSQIFGKYEQQARVAELNRKTPVKTIQSQVDRVTISSEAQKKRAIDAALAAIQASKKGSTETRPASGDNVKLISDADKTAQNNLDKSHELKKKNEEGLAGQADSVRAKFLKKSLELEEKAAAEEAARKKEQYEKEATPF